MMKTWNVWILKKEQQSLILKAMPKPDRFWIELYDESAQKLIKASDVVYDWKQVTPLLQKFRWTEFETLSVAPIFTKLISEIRVETKTYKKPSSRERVLELFDRFRNNEKLSIQTVSLEFGVGKPEVKRDIKIIREFLTRENKAIVYDRADKIYKMTPLPDREELKDIL
jgi:hypothetical protein